MECPVTCPECGMPVELDDLTPWRSTADGGEVWSEPAVCQECASDVVDDEATDLDFKTYQLTEKQAERLEAMTAPVTVLKHDPDSGCVGCPLLRSSAAQCRAFGGRWVDEDDGGVPVPFHRRAPGWCPLRSGHVEVRRG